jgi:DNA-binding MarR family transcriptional regulator
MAEPNETIHQTTRLRIMTALTGCGAGERLDFTRLQRVVGATPGNLGAHLDTLEKAGYVEIEKDFVGRKPRTRIHATRAGRQAFARHLAFLREILELDGAEPSPPAEGG